MSDPITTAPTAEDTIPDTDPTPADAHGRPQENTDDHALDPAAENPADTEESGTTRAARRQQRDTEKYRGLLREVEAERDALRLQVAELHRADVARQTGVPESDITGDDLDAMRESAAAFNARIDAELARRGINAAAPASMVSFGAEHPQVEGGNEFIDAFRPPR